MDRSALPPGDIMWASIPVENELRVLNIYSPLFKRKLQSHKHEATASSTSSEHPFREGGGEVTGKTEGVGENKRKARHTNTETRHPPL